MIKFKAFSLIELMVVVAVISLLATVAVPAYDAYIQKAKVAKARMFVGAVMTDVKHYYSTHGRFPMSVTEMNLPDGGTGLATPTPTGADDYLAPNLAVITIENQGQQPRCASFYMTADISNFSGGDYLTGGGDILHLIYQINDVDGVLIENCQYIPPFSQADVSAGDITTNLNFVVPNCMNTATPAGMAAAFAYSNYINANCM